MSAELPESSSAAPGMFCPACQATYPANQQFCPKDGTQLSAGAPTEKASLVGKVLADRYRIVRKIGEGGMGEVFEAKHVYIDKRYAIKTLRPEITQNPEAVARFHQEARSASTIGHENIIEVDDFGRLEGGGVYLAMEYLDGVSLAERMKKGPPLSSLENFEYLIQVCRGLSAAHGKGIIHRDLKPENIYLARKKTAEGERTLVKVLDFGIAKVVNDTSQERLTRTGSIFGTPHYMSPEQALGKPLDHRTDIYSVGVILYEVYAGKVPFSADSFMGILSMHITSQPVSPSAAAPGRDIPPAIEAVILKAMAKEPDERYQTMDELIQAFVGAGTAAGKLSGEMAARVIGTASRPPSSMLSAYSTSSAVESASAFPVAEPAPTAPEHSSIKSRTNAPSDGSSAAAPSATSSSGEARGVRGVIIVGLACVVVAAGAGAMYLRGAKSSVAAPVTAVAAVAAAPGVAPPTGLTTAAPAPLPPPSLLPPAAGPAAAGTAFVEVVIDTVPSGAKVYSGGKVIAETPDMVKVPQGQSLEVQLRKDGYVTRQVVLDPSQRRKELVKLEHEHKAGSSASTSASPRALPSLPATEAAPAPAPARAAPAPAPIADPYQELPPPTTVRTRPQGTPNNARPSRKAPAGDVMNPY